MELKLTMPIRSPTLLTTFNRTSMELKPFFEKDTNRSLDSFNRTSMELKHTPLTVKRGATPSTFNRTSMELKQGNRAFFFLINRLLIEPVWN